MTQLSVNVNKIAVLRNSRGGRDPDVVAAARACLDAGAHDITVHPRPDARHIREDDVQMGHEATVSKVSEDQMFYCMQRAVFTTYLRSTQYCNTTVFHYSTNVCKVNVYLSCRGDNVSNTFCCSSQYVICFCKCLCEWQVTTLLT